MLPVTEAEIVPAKDPPTPPLRLTCPPVEVKLAFPAAVRDTDKALEVAAWLMVIEPAMLSMPVIVVPAGIPKPVIVCPTDRPLVLETLATVVLPDVVLPKKFVEPTFTAYAV